MHFLEEECLRKELVLVGVALFLIGTTATSVSGCAAPMGFGPVPQPPGEGGMSAVLAGGGGAGPDRANAQGSGRLHIRVADSPEDPGFEFGGTVLFSQLIGFDGSSEFTLIPVLEPGFGMGPFRITVPLSGFALGGGGGGFVYGLAGLTVAYVTNEVTLGATGLVYAVDVTAESGIQSGAQLGVLSFAWYGALDDDRTFSILLGADVAAGTYSLNRNGTADDLDGPFVTGLAYVGLGFTD